MDGVARLGCVLLGLWLGWRWGREALVEEIGEMAPPSWADIQREMADLQ